jgi:2-polyprenyl-3-methyl-5-hydroxy-6-metoxy-1,4-benzoquinol methylase
MDYREKIFAQYVKARQQEIAPPTLEGLQPRSHFINRIIKQHFPKDRNASIVDLGCGHGAFLHFAQKAGYLNILGVDRSPQQIHAAQILGIKNVQEGDLLEFLKGKADASLDTVIAFDVVEHFTKSELFVFLEEVIRCLKTGGSFIIHTPNGEAPFGARMLFWDFTHELAFTRTSIAQVLYSIGFSRVASFEDQPVPHGLKSAARFLLWQMIRCFWRFYLAVETGAGEKECIFSQNFLSVAIK